MNKDNTDRSSSLGSDSSTTFQRVPSELVALAEEARRYKSARGFEATLGVPQRDIMWVRVFGSSVEGRPNPRDIDIFVAVRDGALEFEQEGELCNPIVKQIGKLNYFVMPACDAEELLEAMLYTGRKDPDRAYTGKAVEIESLRSFYASANRKDSKKARC